MKVTRDLRNFVYVPEKGERVEIEKYLARILREISNLRETIDRMNEKLTKTRL